VAVSSPPPPPPPPPRRVRTLAGSPMVRIVARRLVAAVVLLLVVSALSFVLIALTPGDAARAIVGIQAPASEYQHVRHELGLDQSIFAQYWHWLGHAVQGDLGSSLFTGQPVSDAIEQRLPVSLSLIFGALLVSLLVGVPMGVFSAVRGGALGRLADATTLIGITLPSFWVGAILIALFAVDLGWLPATGYVSFADSPGDWLTSLVLPVVALSLGGIAAIAKQTREAMLDALASEHIRMARASGVAPSSILFRHALRNAALPVVTVLGWLFVSLLGGTVVIETVFALPGLGQLAVNAASRADLPLIQGVVVCFTIIVVIVNLIVDLLYLWLDPRVRSR
jgi:peptide/nickel transport system permease protein